MFDISTVFKPFGFSSTKNKRIKLPAKIIPLFKIIYVSAFILQFRNYKTACYPIESRDSIIKKPVVVIFIIFGCSSIIVIIFKKWV